MYSYVVCELNYLVDILYLFTVDGGWSEWREFSPCNAPKCGTGRKMLKRWCSNPPPQKGGNLCEGSNIKYEPCQDFSPGTLCHGHFGVAMK